MSEFPSHTPSVSLYQSSAVLEGLLRGFDLLRGASDEQVAQVLASGRVVSHRRDTLLQGEGQSSETFALILRGRVEVGWLQAAGGQRVMAQLGPGDHFGELALLTGGRLALSALAITDVALFELAKPAFDGLLRGVPVFTENLSRSLGLRFASVSSGRVRRAPPGIVGLALRDARGGAFAAALGAALQARGAPFVFVVPSSSSALLPAELPRLELDLDSDRATRGVALKRVAELRSTHDLVLIVLEPGLEARPDDPLLASCEELWWLAPPILESLAPLGELLTRRRTLQGRARVVWSLQEGERPPPGPRPAGLLEPEFRAFVGQPATPTRRMSLSLRRVVNVLEGRRIGLALGGGGARGFAHCGVLKVLEEEGLAIDRVAGTSMGGLVGMAWAAGTRPERIVREISSAACAPLLLRMLPQGRYLNFAWKARTGAYERSLRSLYERIQFEELDLPLQVVTSDLVEGVPVVRDRGDVTDAVVESINLPVLSRPILRGGRALVDGGILNNLPTDLLVAQGLETILAVDVMASASDSWGRLDAGRRRPGFFESLLRIAELQHQRLSAHGARSADLLLRVNAARFSLIDFELERAEEIAACGEEAARNALPSLRSLVPERWRATAPELA